MAGEGNAASERASGEGFVGGIETRSLKGDDVACFIMDLFIDGGSPGPERPSRTTHDGNQGKRRGLEGTVGVANEATGILAIRKV